ncbi:MAG: electron transfer flavoprotein subunit alpha [Oscillospiraceae bacterium]|nr:electron transfer flavoprotein subunit alpha [Oscillospiraceae bacterium]
MAQLRINNQELSADDIKALLKLCPFSAIVEKDGMLEITAACKMCKICLKKGPAGAVSLFEEKITQVDKDAWRGVAVFAEINGDRIHPVTLELIGKAKELAGVTGHPVYALFIGHQVRQHAQELLAYGVDKVFVYDYKELAHFAVDLYANAFSDFIEKIKPSSVLVGATNIGRSLAPRVAARFETGLTADCTVLEMKENTDLVQIRPAFGGNIMAQIVTPNSRPQFCTVRYKVFSCPAPSQPHGEIEAMELAPDKLNGDIEVLKVAHKAAEVDISDAEIIVAVGRGLTEKHFELAEQLAKILGAELACTRPLIECGRFDAKRQIGLSGRTVKPKFIITLGVSGAVQFAAGMRGSDYIIAINSDKHAPIFEVAHCCIVGDLEDVLPILLEKLKGETVNV